MSREVLEQQCEEMLREAEVNRLKTALRADRKRLGTSRWASTVAWELVRTVGEDWERRHGRTEGH